MVITPSAISMIFQTYRGLFFEVLGKTEVWFSRVATKSPSNTLENVYPWHAMPKGFREWIGERVFNNIRVHGYVLRNKDWEDSLEVPANAIKDDQYGVYTPMVNSLARQAAKLYDVLVADAMRAGTTATGFDGQAFFSTSHPDFNGSTYSNYDASGKALTAANYADVRARMMNFKGEDGRPLNVMPNLLVVPPGLDATARQILNADYIAPASFGQNANGVMQTNVMKGTADLLVLPELGADSTTWYLMDTTKAVLPFILQEREAPVVQGPDEFPEHAFKTNHYIMGASARAAAGYSLPYLCCRAAA